MTLSKDGQALSENRLGRRSTLVRIGSKPRSHGGQLCKPEQTNVGTGGFCSAVLAVVTCSRTAPPYARSFAEQSLPSFQLCGWGRSLSEQQLDTHMCEDTHIHASMPACIQTYNINMYLYCHRAHALILQYTVEAEATAGAGAGAIFIASAVSAGLAGLAPASGAFGCGFGTAGNLEYSFWHGGEEEQTAAKTP